MKTMIAIPAMEQMHSWTAQCLANLEHVGECRTEFVIRMQVDVARNVLAKKAVEGGFDRVLWIDSDMTFEPDMMRRLSDALDAGYDAATGLYFKRTFPLEPVIYRSIDTETPKAEPYWDYPQDALFEVAGCGFACVLISTEILRAVQMAHKTCFLPEMQWGEDLTFCRRARALGYKIYAEPCVKLGHIGHEVIWPEDHERYMARIEQG